MADFTKTAISQNAKREYAAAIPTFDNFSTIITAFESDTTMGITKTRSSSTYKTKVVYFDENSDEKGYAVFYAEDQTQYTSMTEYLARDSAAEAANGENHGGASHDSTEDTWVVKYSCINTLTVGGAEVEDTFTITIGRDYMSINGFSYDETLAKVETWADAQDLLA